MRQYFFTVINEKTKTSQSGVFDFYGGQPLTQKDIADVMEKLRQDGQIPPDEELRLVNLSLIWSSNDPPTEVFELLYEEGDSYEPLGMFLTMKDALDFVKSHDGPESRGGEPVVPGRGKGEEHLVLFRAPLGEVVKPPLALKKRVTAIPRCQRAPTSLEVGKQLVESVDDWIWATFAHR